MSWMFPVATQVHGQRAELYARLSAEHAATAEGLMEDTDERKAS